MDTSFRERATLIRRAWMLLELAIVAAAFAAARSAQGNLIGGLAEPPGSVLPLWAILLLAMLILPQLLSGFGLYHTQRLASVGHQWFGLLKVHAIAVLVAVAAMVISQPVRVRGGFIAVFLVFSYVALAAERALMLQAMHIVRRAGRNSRNAIVVGTNAMAVRFTTVANRHHEWGLRLMGLVRANEEAAAVDLQRVAPVLGTLQSLPALFDREVIDEIIFCVDAQTLAGARPVIASALERGIIVRLVSDSMDVKPHGADICRAGDLYILTLNGRPHDATRLLIKRVVDAALAACLLIALLPVMLAIALLITLTSGGPVLFRQERVGRRGRRFVMYKFRSMRLGSEAVPPELRTRNEMKEPVFKLRWDPRVTALGRLLRAWSLDELPQLWNVLCGDMSLVGPRPLAVEVLQYETAQRRRLSMKPGITGPWQVAGRNHVRFDDWMNLDLEYVDNWSLKTDFVILARTIPAVLSRRGAW